MSSAGTYQERGMNGRENKIACVNYRSRDSMVGMRLVEQLDCEEAVVGGCE